MTARIILVILILAAMIAACDWDWWNVSSGDVYQHVTMQAEQTATAYEATAQFGKDQLNIQLTEVAP